MSLYYEAAEILTTATKGGSLKSHVFGKKSWKSDAKALYALTTETAKWSDVLSEVVQKSDLLKREKLTPTLAILLTHDLLLSKKGVALPATHGLHVAVSRHKVRLSAELTRARLRRRCATLDALRASVNADANASRHVRDGTTAARHPRWIRVNTLKTTLDEELHHGTFSNFTEVTSLDEIVHAAPDARVVYQDAHIPNLLAVATPDDPTTFQAYRNGGLILQEKASCFPAYLLNPESSPGDIVDACAAPGNKTTHLAALVGPENGRRVFACERNPERSQTLRKMVKMARAEKIVTIKEKQDFTRLDPNAREFANVTGLLLDPSCSGSGIFGRDEGSIAVHLPSSTANAEVKGKKRKRGGKVEVVEAEQAVETAIVEEIPEEGGNLATRLINLSTFQLRIVQHAMSFPAAERITYSTCSLHDQENEHVVVKALSSTIATQRGWRVLSREEQMDGLRKWQKRGNPEAVSNALTALDEDMRTQLSTQVDSIADSCIRCDKGGADGTMGFFVAAFVRDKQATAASQETPIPAPDDDDADEWSGFGDD